VPGLRYLAPGTGFGSTPRAGYRAPRNEPNAPTGYASCNPTSITDKALGRGPFIPRSDSAGWVPAWTLGKWLFVPTEAESAVSNRFDSLHISESYADWPKTVQGVESAGQSVYFCRHGGRPNGSPDPGHFRSVGASDPSGTGFAGGIRRSVGRDGRCAQGRSRRRVAARRDPWGWAGGVYPEVVVPWSRRWRRGRARENGTWPPRFGWHQSCIPRVWVFRSMRRVFHLVPGTGYQVSDLAPGTWYPAPEPNRRRRPDTEHQGPSPATGKRAHQLCIPNSYGPIPNALS